MGVFKNGSIFNPVNQLNKIGNAEHRVFGSSARIFDPGAYAFGDAGHVAGAGPTDAGGAFNSGLDPADLFGGQRAAQLSASQNFNPKAPGSIFDMGLPKGPTYNPAAVPAPGTPTNGLANGTMSGGIDWAPIIARALRKT